MLAKGYLVAREYIYLSTAKNSFSYIDALDPVFGLIAECENGRDVNTLLRGPIYHDGLSALTKKTSRMVRQTGQI